jgi:hypothetical protein
MSIRKIIDWQGDKASGDLVGTIASPWYQLYDDQNRFTWACDVDIGQPEVLKGVPVSTNNRDIIYAEVGKPVALKKMPSGSYAIAGLAKSIVGNTHIIYVSFEESLGTVVGEETQGYTIRPLTYPELDTYGGYGVVPYGAYGRFDANGNLLALIY